MDDRLWMEKALVLARQALANDEFPVGCILVSNRCVVAEGRRRGTGQAVASELDHAEILALRDLERRAPDIDRTQVTLYCTMEPCLMCFAAILLNGIGRIVYAYEDVMGGGTGCRNHGLTPLYQERMMPVTAGVCRQESLELFKAFFSNPELDYWRDSLLAQYTLDQPTHHFNGHS